MAHNFGLWLGPTFTALARKSWRMPISPKNAAIFLTTTSKPGMERSVFSAARSAGCSQAVEAIWTSLTRSGIRGMAEVGWQRCETDPDDYGFNRVLVSPSQIPLNAVSRSERRSAE